MTQPAPRERELKLGLEKREDLETLIQDEAFAPHQTFLQVNHYFDADDFRLAHAGALLRLREVDDELVMTFKHGGESKEAEGFFDSLEIECAVPFELLDALSLPGLLDTSPAPPLQAMRQRFGDFPLTAIGSMSTERRRCLETPHKLEMDRVIYPDGGEAYELELETDDPRAAEAWIHDELRKRGIPWTAQRKTKLQVFLERLGVWKDPEG